MSSRATTYYDLLQVPRRARPERVRLAYRQLASRYHPDKQAGRPEAQRVMAALNEAYAVLSDPQQRAAYDRRLDEARQLERAALERRLALIDDPGEAWPWWLLLATVAFSAAAIGISLYKGYVPGAAG